MRVYYYTHAEASARLRGGRAEGGGAPTRERRPHGAQIKGELARRGERRGEGRRGDERRGEERDKGEEGVRQ